MEIYKDHFIKYTYEKENSLLTYIWSNNTEIMPDETYKKLLLDGIGYIAKYKPKYMISNQTQQQFMVTPDLQEWNAKETLPRLFELGIIKFAVIKSETFIIKIATEQIFDEYQKNDYKLKYFANEKEAREWLSK